MRTLEYFRKSEKNYLEKYLEANTCFDRNMDFVSFEKAYTHLYFESKSLGEELQKHSKFTKEIIIEEIIGLLSGTDRPQSFAPLDLEQLKYIRETNRSGDPGTKIDGSETVTAQNFGAHATFEEYMLDTHTIQKSYESFIRPTGAQPYAFRKKSTQDSAKKGQNSKLTDAAFLHYLDEFAVILAQLEEEGDVQSLPDQIFKKYEIEKSEDIELFKDIVSSDKKQDALKRLHNDYKSKTKIGKVKSISKKFGSQITYTRVKVVSVLLLFGIMNGYQESDFDTVKEEGAKIGSYYEKNPLFFVESDTLPNTLRSHTDSLNILNLRGLTREDLEIKTPNDTMYQKFGKESRQRINTLKKQLHTNLDTEFDRLEKDTLGNYMYKKYSMHNNTYIDRTINPKQKELLHTLIDTVFDHLGKKVLAPYMRTFREDFTYGELMKKKFTVGITEIGNDLDGLSNDNTIYMNPNHSILDENVPDSIKIQEMIGTIDHELKHFRSNDSKYVAVTEGATHLQETVRSGFDKENKFLDHPYKDFAMTYMILVHQENTPIKDTYRFGAEDFLTPIDKKPFAYKRQNELYGQFLSENIGDPTERKEFLSDSLGRKMRSDYPLKYMPEGLEQDPKLSNNQKLYYDFLNEHPYHKSSPILALFSLEQQDELYKLYISEAIGNTAERDQFVTDSLGRQKDNILKGTESHLPKGAIYTLKFSGSNICKVNGVP